MTPTALQPGWCAINRDQADRFKGVAILLMLAHHLFGLPTLIAPENAYLPTIPGVPAEYWIGRFGKICVAMFLLLSGYGFAVGAGKSAQSWRYFAGKAWRFLLAYWPYFLLAAVIGALFFQERMANGNWRFPTDPVNLLLNALTIRNTMAFEWWFAETYLLLVLVTRPLLLAARWPLLLLAGSLAAFVAGAALDVLRIDPTDISFANLLIWQFPWVAGILLVRTKMPTRLHSIPARALALVALLMVLAGFVLVEIAVSKAMTPFLILASPLVIFAMATLAKAGPSAEGGVLAWVGARTLGLWLVHPFFCYYFFQDAIYAPYYAPLIFVALLLASLAVVLPVEWLRAKVFKRGARPRMENA